MEESGVSEAVSGVGVDEECGGGEGGGGGGGGGVEEGYGVGGDGEGRRGQRKRHGGVEAVVNSGFGAIATFRVGAAKAAVE